MMKTSNPVLGRALSRRQGFTLVELMVTLVVSSVAMIAIYGMMATTSQTFYHQELSAENQANVRFSAEILKLDLMRAGHNSTPFSDSDPMVCPKPVQAIPAIESVRRSLSLTNPDGSVAVETVDFDDIILSGDPTGLPPFHVLDIAGPRLLTLEPSAAKYLSLFQAPSVLRVANPDGLFQFALIKSSTDNGINGLTVELATDLANAAGNPCGIQGMAEQNHTANVVAAVHYTIEEDPDEALKTNLLRYNFDLVNRVNVGTPILISEYAVGLDILAVGTNEIDPEKTAIVREQSADLLDLDDEDPSNGAGNLTSPLIDLDTAPQRVRFVLYRIQTRTQRAVPRRAVMPDSVVNAAAVEKLYFRLDKNKIAEVRTLQGRVEVANLILRNLR